MKRNLTYVRSDLSDIRSYKCLFSSSFHPVGGSAFPSQPFEQALVRSLAICKLTSSTEIRDIHTCYMATYAFTYVHESCMYAWHIIYHICTHICKWLLRSEYRSKDHSWQTATGEEERERGSAKSLSKVSIKFSSCIYVSVIQYTRGIQSAWYNNLVIKIQDVYW